MDNPTTLPQSDPSMIPATVDAPADNVKAMQLAELGRFPNSTRDYILDPPRVVRRQMGDGDFALFLIFGWRRT